MYGNLFSVCHHLHNSRLFSSSEIWQTEIVGISGNSWTECLLKAYWSNNDTQQNTKIISLTLQKLKQHLTLIRPSYRPQRSTWPIGSLRHVLNRYQRKEYWLTAVRQNNRSFRSFISHSPKVLVLHSPKFERLSYAFWLWVLSTEY